MSALPLKADMVSIGVDVRFVPLADLADRHRLRKLPTAVEDLGSRRDALRLVLAAGLPRWLSPRLTISS